MALTIPLALSLSQRAQAQVETNALLSTQEIAALVGAETLKDPKLLPKLTDQYAVEFGVRLIVMDAGGIVLADSDHSAVGENYNTALRPEIGKALDPTNPQPYALTRYSTELHEELMAAAAPILDEQHLAGAARTTRDVQEVTDARRSVIVGIVVIDVAALLAGVLIAFGVAGSLARPIQRLAGAAKRLGGGDLSTRAGPVHAAAEIEELADSFDEMAARVERTVLAQREFVANASHQLRTPLTGMKLRMETARALTPDPELQHKLDAADQEVDRLAEIVDRLLVMSKQIEQGGPGEVDLQSAARRAVERWQERGGTLGASLSLSGGAVAARANTTDVDQIFDNLLDNAIAYAPGSIEITTEARPDAALIVVRDHGPGIPPAERARVTERFFRGRAAPSGGSGLGLAIARDLAERWHGTLAVDEPEGGGTRVTVRFHRATSDDGTP